MKLKDYNKFYEVGDNRYYVLIYDDELYVATESFVPMEKKFLFFKWKKDLTQGLKLLQLTPPIMKLFENIIDCNIDILDEDFKDMTTYEKVNNVDLRKEIESLYKLSLDMSIDEVTKSFESWKDDFILDNKKLSDEEVEEIIKTNEERLNNVISNIKETNILNSLSFKWNTGENTVVKKMLDTKNIEFLYSQKIGSSYKIYYLYDLDEFGTVTIYKAHCVNETLKSIESFVYNRELIQELTAFIVNNEL